MTITRRFVGRVAVLTLDGRVTASANDAEMPPLRAALGGLLAEGRIDFALDLSRVRQIDAGGLGELAFMLTTVRNVGGHVTLIAPQDRVSRMLSVTRLDRFFDRCEGREDPAGGTWGVKTSRDYGVGGIDVW